MKTEGSKMKERPILFSSAMVRAILKGSKTQTRRVCKNLRWVETHGAVFMGKPVPDYWRYYDKNGSMAFDAADVDHMTLLLKQCPYGVPEDRLWVRETFSTDATTMYPCPKAWYRATDSIDFDDRIDGHVCPKESRGRYADCLTCWEEREGRKFRWRPSIFMRREFSRITLEVVSVRVERLQDISEADAMAEGIHRFEVNGCEYFHARPTAPTEEHFTSAVMAYRDLWESINGAGSWALNPWVWLVEFRKTAEWGQQKGTDGKNGTDGFPVSKSHGLLVSKSDERGAVR